MSYLFLPSCARVRLRCAKSPKYALFFHLPSLCLRGVVFRTMHSIPRPIWISSECHYRSYWHQQFDWFARGTRHLGRQHGLFHGRRRRSAQFYIPRCRSAFIFAGASLVISSDFLCSVAFGPAYSRLQSHTNDAILPVIF